MTMVKLKNVLIFGAWLASCDAREPFKPAEGSVPFLVYFMSRYRGLCVGTLLSRTTVITACVCIANPTSPTHDTRPINVVAGATYRHPRRGIRVQVTKIIMPKLSNSTQERAFTIQKSPAMLILARKVADVLAEIPLRAIDIEYKGEEELSLHEECLMAGWHFFYKGDKIYPVHKFLLQRNIRVQYLNVAKKSLFCNTIDLKFQNAMTNMGYLGTFDKDSFVCVKDGMYGAPLICRGRAFALLTSPDAQWTNCTGFSNLVLLFSATRLRNFLTCASSLYEPEYTLNWDSMKKSLENDDSAHHYDYLPDVYDHMVYNVESSDEV